MSSSRQVFSDSAFTAVTSIVSILRGLAVIPLITNLLGASTYGIWVTLIAALTFLTSTTGIHLHGALIRYGSQDFDKNQAYSDTLFLTIAISTASALVLIGSSFVVDLSAVFDSGIGNYQDLVIIFSLLLVMRMILSININFPRSKGHSRYYDLIRIAQHLLETFALVTIFLLGGGLIAGLGGLALSAFLLNFSLFGFILYRYHIPHPNSSGLFEYVRFGVPMIPKEVSSSILQDIDKYLLLFFVGSGAVGVYSVAQKICRPIVNLTSIFNPTLYPTVTRAWRENDEETIKEIYTSIFRYYTLLGVPAVFGLLLVADPMMVLVSNTDIASEGVFLVPVFIAGYFLRGYGNPLRYILTSVERTDLIGGIVTAGVLLNIVLNVILIPEFGMLGAAFATLAAQILLCYLTFYFANNSIPFSIPRSTVVRSCCAALVMFVSLWSLPVSLGTWGTLIAYPPLGVLVYFITIFLLGEFSQSEQNFLWDKLLL